MKPQRQLTLAFTATPQMADVLTRVLRLKSREKGTMVNLSSYIKELLIRDIEENYLRK